MPKSADTNDLVTDHAMWWPSGNWHEGHNSPGATTTGTSWAIAEGEDGGPRGTQTYILVANTSAVQGIVKATLAYEDGVTEERTFTVAANSRFNIDVRAAFPGAAERRFGAVVPAMAQP